MRSACFMVRAFVVAAVAAAGSLAGCTTERVQYGAPLARDLDGAWHNLGLYADVASVLIFITNDCPIANGYAPEINGIVSDYAPRGFEFFIVHVDPDLGAEQARAHAKAYGYQCPVLWDEHHELVKMFQAKVTPEAVVMRMGGRQVLYQGRIDDRIVDFGKKRIAPSQRDLRDALDAILAGKPVPHPRTNAIGCAIPELNSP